MRSADSLLNEVYSELKALAQRRVAGGQTLDATELVHEVWLRMRDRSWDGPTHFKAVAATAMRQVVIDRVRRRERQKRGGKQLAVTLSGLAEGPASMDLLDLHRALEALEAHDARKARLAELKLFGGLTLDELAVELDVSRTTVKTEWRVTRAWLASALD